jgi:hypothetical protein
MQPHEQLRCEHGIARGCYDLGYMYEYGYDEASGGPPKDGARAAAPGQVIEQALKDQS